MKINLPDTLTFILVKDEITKGFTAFFAEVPNVIAEGDDEQEAKLYLLILMVDVLKHEKSAN